MITMVEKWIHRECERDVADLVQPTQSWSGGPCAVCKQTFGAVWLNEVEEAVSEPSEPIEPEPELEVIAVLEEPLGVIIEENVNIDVDGSTFDDDGRVIYPEPDVEKASKEAEIAALEAKIAELKKEAE